MLRVISNAYISGMFSSRLARLVVVSLAQLCSLLQSSYCFTLLLFLKCQQSLLHMSQYIRASHVTQQHQCLLNMSHNIKWTVTSWQKNTHTWNRKHSCILITLRQLSTDWMILSVKPETTNIKLRSATYLNSASVKYKILPWSVMMTLYSTSHANDLALLTKNTTKLCPADIRILSCLAIHNNIAFKHSIHITRSSARQRPAQ